MAIKSQLKTPRRKWTRIYGKTQNSYHKLRFQADQSAEVIDQHCSLTDLTLRIVAKIMVNTIEMLL